MNLNTDYEDTKNIILNYYIKSFILVIINYLIYYNLI